MREQRPGGKECQRLVTWTILEAAVERIAAVW